MELTSLEKLKAITLEHIISALIDYRNGLLTRQEAIDIVRKEQQLLMDIKLHEIYN